MGMTDEEFNKRYQDLFQIGITDELKGEFSGTQVKILQEEMNRKRIYYAIWNEAIEAAAKIIDECNREGPYNAIGGAKRIRELKK